MVLSVLNCGCLHGLAIQGSKSRTKYKLIEDEATSSHDENTQAKIKAFHDAKQQHDKRQKHYKSLRFRQRSARLLISRS